MNKSTQELQNYRKKRRFVYYAQLFDTNFVQYNDAPSNVVYKFAVVIDFPYMYNINWFGISFRAFVAEFYRENSSFMLSERKNRIFLILISALLVISTVLMIASVCSVKVNLRLYIDGAEIGVVEDASVVQSIRDRVASDISAAAYGADSAECTVTYGYAEGRDAEELLSDEQIYKALYIALLKNHTAAYGVYANGSFVAANTDPSVIADAVTAVRIAAQGGDDLEVELTGTLEVKSLYYPVTALRAGSEITELLLGSSDELYRTVNAGRSSIVAVDIDASLDETMFFGPGGGQVVSSETDGDGRLIVSIKVTETVPFITEYRRNDELFIGTYEKSQDGADGKKEVIYQITYEDGVPVSREVISEQTVLAPIPKVIDEGAKTKPSTASKSDYEWPIKRSFTLTDTYGGRTVYGKYSFHYAIDLAVPTGTPIYAANGGVVTKSDYNSSYGYHVIIKHDNGQETLYAHMRTDPIVSVGERVYQGQQIGEVGSTGYATGPHLHFEIRIDGEKVDPLKYLP